MHGLTVQDGTLVRHGRPYRGVGANCFSLFYHRLKDPSDDFWRYGLRQLSEAGIPFVRFACCGFWPLEWEMYREDRDNYFALLDEVVQAAEDYNVGLIPSLFWHVATVPDIVGEHMDQLGNPDSDSLDFIRNYTEEIVVRYRNSPAIWGWEYGNEFNLHVDLPNAKDHRPQVVPRLGTATERDERDEFKAQQMLTAYAAFAEVVRRYDNERILITGNSIPRPSAYHNSQEGSWERDTVEQFCEILQRDNPDPFNTLSVHIYPNRKPDELYQGGAKDIPSLMQLLQKQAESSGKPVFVGEFGASAEMGKDAAREAFREIVNSIESSGIALAAFWVFNYSNQDGSWNVTLDNDRAYMLELVSLANRSIAQE